MRVTLNGYEVEVKAKGYGSTRFNKQDTMAFLCALYCDLIEARDNYKSRKLVYCAGAVQNGMDSIHKILDENHYSSKSH